ncbi:DnaT-like ssDNA-binding protein [Methyloversatilis discipulorum]|uniref:DnaT-like ssDNA-binding protein n=1 Tax=Methyloversatilis discipulorum TaxID=1119528 RepID=UPI003137E988
MALIVEDGTGRPDADSYVPVAFADQYLAAMGASAWAAASVPAREVALRKATAYVEAAYMWRGERSSGGQALSWPRAGVCRDGVVVASNAVPVQVQRAVCELAAKALTVDLMPDVAPEVVTEETVGPISTSYGQARNGGLTRFSLVDSMLRGLTLAGGAGGSVRVVRA